MIRLVFILLALCAVSCLSAELAPQKARIRLGPAHGKSIRRVVALPAACGSLALAPEGAGTSVSSFDAPSSLHSECAARDVAAVDNSVRALLEFQGFDIIDSEKVNAETRVRTETENRIVSSGYESSSKETEISGAKFADATPKVQQAILGELGAEGLLNTRIWISAEVGMGGRRTIEVQVRLLHAPTGQLAWAKRCELEYGGIVSDTEAMEKAVRCAVEGMMAQ